MNSSICSRLTPVGRGAAARRFGISLPIAAIGATLLMVAVFGISPDLPVAAGTGLFRARLAFPLCISIGATRLARPGKRVAAGWPVMVAPFILVSIVGLVIVATAAPQDRLTRVLGQSWKTCPFNILLLSLPGFAPILVAAKELAPIHLRMTGAAAGLLASCIGTVAYCFHCPELSPAFWSV